MGGGGGSTFQKLLDVLTHKLPQSPPGLKKYEVVVVGKNLGAVFTKRFSHLTHGHNTMCSVTSGGAISLNVGRLLYEQSRMSKTDYFINSKLGICASAAGSDGCNVGQYLPDENAVVLTNGRRIEYDHLVVATGMKYDFDAIEGFYDAWGNTETPIYASLDHPTWKVFDTKYQRHIGNFTHGDAYFYIPPGPFKGEVADYNFLATQAAWDYYKQIGKVSPTSRYFVINGNDYFSQHDPATDAFFKSECDKRGIEVIWGKKMTSVNSDNQTFALEDLKTGETETRDFNNLYVLPPCKPQQNLIDAGLSTAESNNFLDVDQETLRHKKYPNIFGLGDCNNLPTTKSYFGGCYQLHVAANNVFRNLKGLPLNAKYDGYSKTPLFLDQNKMTYSTHTYKGPTSNNLWDAAGGPGSRVRFLWWAKAHKKRLQAIYTNKTPGPPYGKLGAPKWPELKADEAQKDSMKGYHVVRAEGEQAPQH